MRLLRNERVVNILENTLNEIDTRLVGHGKRSAYLMFRVLNGRYRDARLRDICLLAMLHDVGAYKTEEISNMYNFETSKVWEHSIYGFLFLKHFSPLADMAQVVLYHHSPYRRMAGCNGELMMLAQLAGLTNIADMSAVRGRSDTEFRKYIENRRDKTYQSAIIDMFLAAGINIGTIAEDTEHDTAFGELFYNTPLTEQEVDGYIKMIISSIDFRSSQTVIHTRAVACIAEVLARLANVPEADIEKVKTGALLHDIGKVSTPIHILEGTSEKLSAADMAVMRGHVVVSEKILDGNVDEEVKNIAVNHHEKIDGTGYPKGLAIRSPLERLMAVADVFSALCGARSYKKAYPKEKIIKILKSMVSQKHLSAEFVELAIQNYDKIISAANIETDKAIADYVKIGQEYERLIAEVQR